MVRDVVCLLRVCNPRGMRARAAGRAIGILRAQVESTLEEAPGHAARVQQIADVLSRELYERTGRRRAHIANRISIVDQAEAAIAVFDTRAARVRLVGHTV